MPDLPDPYGWDAWVAQTDHRIVAAMIRDKCERITELEAELKRLRNICENASACVSKVASHGHTSTGHHFKLIGVANTLAEEGKKP